MDLYPVRLRGGRNSSEGRVEIFYNGQWGTVCDHQWDIHDATVVCNSLGYAGAASAPTGVCVCCIVWLMYLFFKITSHSLKYIILDLLTYCARFIATVKVSGDAK